MPRFAIADRIIVVVLLSCFISGAVHTTACAEPLAEPLAEIARRLPPQGIELTESQRDEINEKLAATELRLKKHADHTLAADVAVFTEAVRLAVHHNEFYKPQDAELALSLLRSANERLDSLDKDDTPWVSVRGVVVRGYTSSVDGSPQPYGLVIPEKLDLSRPVPLYVWLHGRGDSKTNMAFLQQRQSQIGQVAPEHAIVLHPWGRHCIGYKSASEIDVVEAIEHVATQYKIDRRRIVLMGFSMGGAGVWHLGAHYTDRFVAMSPGAGFAETARYAKVDPKITPNYEQKLWGVYDAPKYVRNLFNFPVIAYSGENDKQIQAARVMEEAFEAEGKKLDHRIGPGMGHKYHPETLKQILSDIKTHCDRGLNLDPAKVTLQTRTLRYHQMHWVDIQRLERHWQDSRVDAHRTAEDQISLETKNIAELKLSPANLPLRTVVNIDGQKIEFTYANESIGAKRFIHLEKHEGKWRKPQESEALWKRPGLQGPIDDAFLDPFLVVLPSGKCINPQAQRWVEFESQHFLDRWQAAFRGKARVKRDTEVTADDIARYHLILWGDSYSNSVIKRLAAKLPINWNPKTIRVGDQIWFANSHVLSMIYPNPESSKRYIVLNSGPTFREGHDRTNSLQNPKLPDWAIIDLSQLPSDTAPGRVVAADFFDEQWNLRK